MQITTIILLVTISIFLVFYLFPYLKMIYYLFKSWLIVKNIKRKVKAGSDPELENILDKLDTNLLKGIKEVKIGEIDNDV